MTALAMSPVFLVSTIRRLPVAVPQTRWPSAFSVRESTWPGRRFFISSAMRLLNARERIGWTGSALAIMTRVLVLAAPARALMRRDWLAVLAKSMMACCSGVGRRAGVWVSMFAPRVRPLLAAPSLHDFVIRLAGPFRLLAGGEPEFVALGGLGLTRVAPSVAAVRALHRE
jgi:hypothetical protein